MAEELRKTQVALVTPFLPDYWSGLRQSMIATGRYDGTIHVASMPEAILAMATYKAVQEAARSANLNTSTIEFRGVRYRRGLLDLDLPEASYEVLHGINLPYPHKEVERFRDHFMEALGDQIDGYIDGLCGIDGYIWDYLGNAGIYAGGSIDSFLRLPLEEIKKGNAPEPGTFYSIYVLDRARPSVSPPGSRLDYDGFMRDDRMLMLAGSCEERELLAIMLFGAEKDGGEGLPYVYNRYQIGDVGRDLYAITRQDFPMGNASYLRTGNGGLDGGFPPGQFMLVGETYGDQLYEDLFA